MPLDVTKGFTPARKLGSTPNNSATGTYPIRNGYATAIGNGDPVLLSAGFIKLGANGSPCIGVLGGVRYIDADSRLVFTPNFIAATSSKGGVEVEGGYTQPLAYVYDDPGQTYVVRTLLTALPVSAVGRSYRMSAIGSVNAIGQSEAVLDVNATAGTSAGDGHMVTVIGIWKGQDSNFGTGATPIAVEVKLSNYGSVQEL